MILFDRFVLIPRWLLRLHCGADVVGFWLVAAAACCLLPAGILMASDPIGSLAHTNTVHNRHHIGIQ